MRDVGAEVYCDGESYNFFTIIHVLNKGVSWDARVLIEHKAFLD